MGQIKAIILAAGRGSRLNKYTKNLPKGMLEVYGKPILLRQIENYKSLGINDITIVTGFASEKIDFADVKYYHNKEFASTNMVESLFCAQDKLDGEVIVSYADIIFSNDILEKVISSTYDIGVVADKNWEEYWRLRYGKIDFDIESFSVNSNDEIVELGAEVDCVTNIDGRYVGVIKLSKDGVKLFKDTYRNLKSKFSSKIWLGGRVFEQAYMTDFIQNLIDSNYTVNPIWVDKGWVEFDTNEDYELVINNKAFFKDILS
jgi:L-glutamine-phosphate cytidylyltransferase